LLVSELIALGKSWNRIWEERRSKKRGTGAS
jgi:hypothetical protein